MDGYKFVGASTDDVETGSLQLTGDAVKNHVTKGTTFYTVDPKNSLTGTLERGGGGSNGSWQAGNGGTNTGGGAGGNYQGYISTGGSGVVLIRLK